MARLNAVTARVLASFFTVALPVVAQTPWPDRPIQLIVPFPAGGAIDVIARPFAERMSELLRQPVVVVPRDGAAGTIGTAAVVSAKPDGYTLGFVPNGPLVVQPHVIATLAYKFESVVPLCQVFAVQYVIAVRADSAIKSLEDFVSAAKAQPGKLSYGFGGVATAPHLAMSQFGIAANLDILAVPFRGDPAAILALKGGEIDAAALNLGLALAQGFRALATFADVRQAEYPNAPTLKESGLNVVSSAYGGVISPKGLPDEVAQRIESACRQAVLDERFQKAARASSQQAVFRNSADFARVLADDFVQKREIVRKANLGTP